MDRLITVEGQINNWGLLVYDDLCRLQDLGVIRNSKREHVNPASIDVTLGETVLIEYVGEIREIDLEKRELLKMAPWKMSRETRASFSLQPGEFILAQTEQEFWLPDDISIQYVQKSSSGRSALEQLNAGWGDPGWHGSVLTLELKNMAQYHAIRLRKGVRVGQIKFFRHAVVPSHASYAVYGHYNGDQGPRGAKF